MTKTKINNQNIAIFIPARMASTRLPNKPLADICGEPMIVHVLKRALESGIKDVYVACSEEEVKDAVEKYAAIDGRSVGRVKAIMTDPDLPSGTDRIYQAMQKSGEDYDIIVNLQGDLPTLNPEFINKAVDLLDDEAVDVATLVTIIKDDNERNDPNVVKAVGSFASGVGRALYFTRSIAPYGEGDLYHHIGLYAYRGDSLKRFVSLPPSPLEKREKLEQLRALENQMRIDVAVIDEVPLGVDTAEDLEAARRILASDL